MQMHPRHCCTCISSTDKRTIHAVLLCNPYLVKLSTLLYRNYPVILLKVCCDMRMKLGLYRWNEIRGIKLRWKIGWACYGCPKQWWIRLTSVGLTIYINNGRQQAAGRQIMMCCSTDPPPTISVEVAAGTGTQEQLTHQLTGWIRCHIKLGGFHASPLLPQIITFIIIMQIADQVLYNEKELNIHLWGITTKFPAQLQWIKAELVFVVRTRSAVNINFNDK